MSCLFENILSWQKLQNGKIPKRKWMESEECTAQKQINDARAKTQSSQNP